MVGVDPVADLLELRGLHHAGADLGVRADERPLLLAERPALAEQRVGHAHPAHVVQHAGDPDPLHGAGRAGRARAPISSAKRATRWQWVAFPLSRTSSASARFRSIASSTWSPVVAARRAGEDARHLRARDHGPVAAEPLGRVERLVAGLEQAVGGLPVQREARRSRTRSVSGTGAFLKACSHLGAHPLGEDVGAVLVGVRGEDRELLAAHARRAVEAALGLASRASRHAAQGVVARSVARESLTRLKRSRSPTIRLKIASLRRARSELRVEHLLEAAAVQEPRERVHVRGVGQAGHEAGASACAPRRSARRRRAGCPTVATQLATGV